MFVQRTPITALQVAPPGATWTKAKNAPPVSVGAMLLLTDGRVFVHSEPNCQGCIGNYNHRYTLTPDIKGATSLAHGSRWLLFLTTTRRCSLARLCSLMTKLSYKTGNTIARAEPAHRSGNLREPFYDPSANTWTATKAPSNSNIGDAQSVVLPNGTWMLAECCAISFGHSSFPVYYTFNESTLSFTAKSNSSDGKNDDFDEEEWNLLANGEVMTVDAYTPIPC